jgi:hypothetical protein
MNDMRLLLVLVVVSAAFLAAAEAGDAVDPADWTYQLISPRGRARLVQRCEGPAACKVECFNRRGRLLWSSTEALAERPGTAVADDGIHVVHVNELLPSENTGAAEALAFYTRGKLIRRYLVRDLIDKPDALPVVGERRKWISDWRFTTDGRGFEFSVNGRTRAFSLATGEAR